MSAAADSPRGRGRGRGNRGKALRARGRRGARPAEFGSRLRMEDEESADEEELAAIQAKYARRGIDTNAFRYEEPEQDDEVEPEPEVDLEAFLARQRLDDDVSPLVNREDEDDVDHSLGAVTKGGPSKLKPRKNQVHTVEWDESLDELKREKESAEAVRDLKTRFRQAQPRLTAKPTQVRETRKSDKVEDARHVPKPPDADDEAAEGEGGAPKPGSKAEMETFLDDLLG